MQARKNLINHHLDWNKILKIILMWIKVIIRVNHKTKEKAWIWNHIRRKSFYASLILSNNQFSSKPCVKQLDLLIILKALSFPKLSEAASEIDGPLSPMNLHLFLENLG